MPKVEGETRMTNGFGVIPRALCAVSMVVIFARGSASLAQETALVGPPPLAARDVHGAGLWKSDGKQGRGSQHWKLDVVRGPDDSLRGRISVANSPVIADANVDGRISGDIVRGLILDDAGIPLASFEGKVSPGGITGKYTDRSGETGQWAWHGSLMRAE